jgi:F0F1-type ATP synthase assembly protein I
VKRAGPAPNVVGLILIGSELVSLAVAGVLADYGLGTSPVFAAIGAILGMVLASWHGYRLLTRPPAPQ